MILNSNNNIEKFQAPDLLEKTLEPQLQVEKTKQML